VLFENSHHFFSIVNRYASRIPQLIDIIVFLTLLPDLIEYFVLDIFDIQHFDLKSPEILVLFPPIPKTVVHLQLTHHLSHCAELPTFYHTKEQIDLLTLRCCLLVSFIQYLVVFYTACPNLVFYSFMNVIVICRPHNEKISISYFRNINILIIHTFQMWESVMNGSFVIIIQCSSKIILEVEIMIIVWILFNMVAWVHHGHLHLHHVLVVLHEIVLHHHHLLLHHIVF